MHLYRTSANGSPNIGLFGYTVDNKLLFGEHIPDNIMQDILNALGNPELHHVRIAGTSMPGIFLAGNSKTILVPGIAFDEELAVLDEIGVKYTVFDTEKTCLGNNIVANDHGAIISTDFSDKEAQQISDLLEVPVERMDIAGLTTPGSFIVLNGQHGIIHRDSPDEEIEQIEKILKVELTPATVNLGTPYLRAGIICNDKGFVIGSQTSGPEVVHLDESLGFLEDD